MSYRNLEEKIDRLTNVVNGLKDDLGRLERRVPPESGNLQIPVSRGTQYHGGVGVHSVSGATSGLKRYTR